MVKLSGSLRRFQKGSLGRRERVEEMVFEELIGGIPQMGYKSGYAKGYAKGFKVPSPPPFFPLAPDLTQGPLMTRCGSSSLGTNPLSHSLTHSPRADATRAADLRRIRERLLCRCAARQAEDGTAAAGRPGQGYANTRRHARPGHRPPCHDRHAQRRARGPPCLDGEEVKRRRRRRKSGVGVFVQRKREGD